MNKPQLPKPLKNADVDPAERNLEREIQLLETLVKYMQTVDRRLTIIELHLKKEQP